MFIETIEVARILPKELQIGNKILNVGIITRIDEWANVYVVGIKSPCLNNVKEEIELPKYHTILVDSVDEKPVIY
jgi:hypothetical protein